MKKVAVGGGAGGYSESLRKNNKVGGYTIYINNWSVAIS